MNLIISGPQGSGKGTQAELLVKNYGFNYIEMGSILRSVANSDNKYAGVVKETMKKGQRVPDEYTRLIAWDHISKADKSHGFLFDGYPRSLAQYEHLEDMLKTFGQKIDRLIYVWISEEEVIKRLSARRTCQKCGEIYNLLTKPPKDPEVCDKCGGKLMHREDDKPEAIKNRLAWGYALEVKERARQEGILLEVNGERPIETIYEEIVKGLGI